MDKTIYGLDLDQQGRCHHYHQANDIAALKCTQCQQYYACYQCHNALADHLFVACDPNDLPVLCGVCQQLMNYNQYVTGVCPSCQSAFNPKCSLHRDIYFKESACN
ncbi:CHY zinc finger protein [Convivina intestini]|uniref:Putative CHY-type Zn-finger protein n=1 Tax=Convivina intestini TaxID=1505726 RepID=A0A2U1DFN4_9LACO|nr:CHY zinc finger protein [Convivina intestini]PVY86362.1 putative CHY-type Zn-finger protein [Convivina intestini]CAH1850663.1 hypothetical protein R077811_00136 [Convivina intestini]SDB82915.1 Uncharacterized protein, contains Zn-finger domain of CHY type [Leuconostocaceae bacterium R-53105]